MKRLEKKKIAYLANLLDDVSRLKKSQLREHLVERPECNGLSVDELVDEIQNGSKIYREEIRLSLAESIEFHRKAIHLNMSVSELIRNSVQDNISEELVSLKRAASLNNKLLVKIHGEINVIGRNLNQVAKHCSTLASINMAANPQALMAQLQVTHAQLIYVGMLLECANPAYIAQKYVSTTDFEDGELPSFYMDFKDDGAPQAH